MILLIGRRCRALVGPPPSPLPALDIPVGFRWMKSKSGDTTSPANLTTRLHTTRSPRWTAYEGKPGERVLDIRGCRALVRQPPSPLPALDISMGPLWMRSKSGDTTRPATLPTPRDLHSLLPRLSGLTRGVCARYLRV